jgi:hypothetical protein
VRPSLPARFAPPSLACKTPIIRPCLRTVVSIWPTTPHMPFLWQLSATKVFVRIIVIWFFSSYRIRWGLARKFGACWISAITSGTLRNMKGFWKSTNPCWPAYCMQLTGCSKRLNYSPRSDPSRSEQRTILFHTRMALCSVNPATGFPFVANGAVFEIAFLPERLHGGFADQCRIGIRRKRCDLDPVADRCEWATPCNFADEEVSAFRAGNGFEETCNQFIARHSACPVLP